MSEPFNYANKTRWEIYEYLSAEYRSQLTPEHMAKVEHSYLNPTCAYLGECCRMDLFAEIDSDTIFWAHHI